MGCGPSKPAAGNIILIAVVTNNLVPADQNQAKEMVSKPTPQPELAPVEEKNEIETVKVPKDVVSGKQSSDKISVKEKHQKSDKTPKDKQPIQKNNIHA
jgi:hypothetical protein